MTDLRTAAQQALEALEALRLGMPDSILVRSLDQRITALKAALAEPVQEVLTPEEIDKMADVHLTSEIDTPVGEDEPVSWVQGADEFARAVEGAVLRKLGRSAEPVQEPVAIEWQCVPVDLTADMRNAFHGVTDDDVVAKGAAGSRWAAMLAVAPQRPAEPVGIVSSLVKGGVVWQRWPADMPDGTRLFSEVQP